MLVLCESEIFKKRLLEIYAIKVLLVQHLRCQDDLYLMKRLGTSCAANDFESRHLAQLHSQTARASPASLLNTKHSI